MAGTPQEPGAPPPGGGTAEGWGEAPDGSLSADGPADDLLDGGPPDDLDDFDDSDVPADDADRHSGFDRWRRRSATGAVLTGIALGLQEVFQPPRDEPAIVVTADDGADDPPRPVEVHLDLDDPSATVAIVRPWLGREGDGPRA